MREWLLDYFFKKACLLNYEETGMFRLIFLFIFSADHVLPFVDSPAGGLPFAGIRAGSLPFADSTGDGGLPFADSPGDGGLPFADSPGDGSLPFADSPGDGSLPFADSPDVDSPPFAGNPGVDSLQNTVFLPLLSPPSSLFASVCMTIGIRLDKCLRIILSHTKKAVSPKRKPSIR
ncbi:hypothetical protein [Neobacillus niacini]|uniref:hypothetical protein n=1 Tax=Neobacillus niacini TaxID=86668 RepID=UPI00286A380F|nr:hypothetical protein [Neobacillus niacini]